MFVMVCENKLFIIFIDEIDVFCGFCGEGELEVFWRIKMEMFV